MSTIGSDGRRVNPVGPVVDRLGPDDPPDLAAFRSLVEARRRYDHKAALPALAHLRRLGWVIAPCVPKPARGER